MLAFIQHVPTSQQEYQVSFKLVSPLYFFFSVCPSEYVCYMLDAAISSFIVTPLHTMCANSQLGHSVASLHPGLRGCRSSTPTRIAAFCWFPSRPGDRGWISRQLATSSLWSCLRVRRGCDRRKTDFTDAIRCAVAPPDKCVCCSHQTVFAARSQPENNMSSSVRAIYSP